MPKTSISAPRGPHSMASAVPCSSHLLTEQYPSGRVLTTTYDSANRPATLAGTLGGVTTNYMTQTEYWPNGTPWFFTRGGNNNVTHANAINSRMQVPESYGSIGNANNSASMLFVSCPNWGVNPSNYGTWDICPHTSSASDNGNLQSYREIWGGPTNLTFDQNLVYDGLSRLLSATNQTGSTVNWLRTYNYDQWGNMWLSPTGAGPVIPTSTPTTNVYNSATNRNGNLNSLWPASYDNAGNLQTLNSMTTAAGYNAENQLTTLNTNPGAAAGLAYDALGNRVQQSVSGKWPVRYVYDAFGLASVYVNGAWSKDYIADGGGRLIATENAAGSTCTTCYYGFDHLGSVRLVMDQNGGVVSRHDYLPFGEEIAGGIVGRDSHFGSMADVTEKFTGQIRDQDSGVDYFNARYLALPLGRFSSPDPGNAGTSLLSSQSWNGYGYVWGNPLANTDPTGMDCGGFENLTGDCTSPVDATNPDIPKLPPWVTTVYGGGTDEVGTPIEPIDTTSLDTAGATLRWQIGCALSGDPHACLGYVPFAGSPCILQAPSGKYTLVPNAVALFQPPMVNALNTAFKSLNDQGIVPMITSGFRTAADQLRMQNGGSGANPAAAVSWHQVGLAVDLNHNVPISRGLLPR